VRCPKCGRLDSVRVFSMCRTSLMRRRLLRSDVTHDAHEASHAAVYDDDGVIRGRRAIWLAQPAGWASKLGLKSSSSVFALWRPAPDVTRGLNPAPSSGSLIHDKGLADRGDRVIGCAAGTCCPDGDRSCTRSAQPGRAPGDTRTAPADAANADASNADATNADAANADATNADATNADAANADAASSAHGDFRHQRGVFSGRGDCGGSEAKLSGCHRLAGH